MKKLRYSAGYKYLLLDDYRHQTGIVGFDYDGRLLKLSPDGELWIRSGYSWDGPSGPTIDSEDFIRGSLVHDAMYQLMREEILSLAEHREVADGLLHAICLEDGMPLARANYVYCAVRACGELSATPEHLRPVAPTFPATQSGE